MDHARPDRLRVEREREKKRVGTSIFSSEERCPANSLLRPLLPYAQYVWYYACCSVQECYESHFTIVVVFYQSSQTCSDNGSFRETQEMLTILISLKEIPDIRYQKGRYWRKFLSDHNTSSIKNATSLSFLHSLINFSFFPYLRSYFY